MPSTTHTSGERTDVGCLRREYFEQDEWVRSTLSGARAYGHQAPEQGFTLRGHRLSSLYRMVDKIALSLIPGKDAPGSSCQK